MRVRELAVDLRVSTEILLRFLRESGVAVGSANAAVRDSDVARIRMRIERERRLGGGDATQIMRQALQGSTPKSRRRRVSRKRASARRRASVDAGAQAPETAVAAADPAQAADGAAKEAAAVQAEAASVPADAAAPPTDAAAEAASAATADAATEQDAAAAAAAVAPPAEEAAVPGAPAEDEAPPARAAAPSERTGDVTPADVPAPDAAAVRPAAQAGPAQPAAPAAAGPSRRPAPPAAGAGLVAARHGMPVSARAADAAAGRPAPAASAGPGGTVRIQAEGYTADGRRKKARRKGKGRRAANRDQARANIQRVMKEIGGRGRRKRRRVSVSPEELRRQREAEAQRVATEKARKARMVRVNEYLTVAEIGELIDITPSELVTAAFRDMSLMVTINQRLDFDQIEMLLDGFGFQAIREKGYVTPADQEKDEDDPAELRPRPPVVTVMGHVDHGKTKLLDWIRNTNVVAGESGGITQHIGAYHVDLGGDGNGAQRSISFLDTPGHAAFTAMRARGADVTDLVVLVVAADDAVMPQTIEAISHARNAGVPMVVAINKMDLPSANPDRVKQDLLRHEVTVEDYGGDVLVTEVSARTGQGMQDLLDKVLLQAEMLELQANPSRKALGAVVEAELNVGKGPVATVLVRNGTLRVGDSYLVGLHSGRIRALLDERGQNVQEAGPGIPVQILGTAGVPQAGDELMVMDKADATAAAANRQRLDREKQMRIRERGIRLGDFGKLMADGDVSTLRLLVKGDVDGSVQAVCDSMEQLSTAEVKVEIIHRGVGAINESDIMLALTAEAVVLGFRVRPDTGGRQAAARESVEIQTFDIIYEAVDNVRAALEGMLAPERREKIAGAAEIRAIFKIKGVGTIAGSYVIDGIIQRGSLARVIRDGVVIYNGEVSSLKRFKEDVREVRDNFECGIGISNFNDLKVGDQIETYSVEEVARTWDDAAGTEHEAGASLSRAGAVR